MAGDDVLQKIRSSLNRGIATISIKTTSPLEKSKIKTHIESLEKDIEKDIVNIGNAFYKIWSSELTDFSNLFAQCEIIKSKYSEIDVLTVELSSIDERNNQILGNTATETETEQKPSYFCTNCGAKYENLAKFCRKCGNKMSE